MSTKNKVIGVRVDAIMQSRLERFEHATRVDAVTLIRAATEAALDYFEQRGTIRFPLVMRPIDELPPKTTAVRK